MNNKWFRRRGYRHLDIPVCEKFAERIQNPSEVAKHSFSPLLHYLKKTKRYKPAQRQTVVKERPIMYASHRDACILSYYAWQLSQQLENHYQANNLQENIVAYRSPGRSNYELAAEVLRFANQISPCVVLAFDVSGFFDNLNHALLKKRLKTILSMPELPADWYSVFKFVTKYHYVQLDDLKGHPVFGDRIAKRTSPIASITELNAEKVQIRSNPTPGKGIPQGTPISATLSNLYMMDFDVATKAYCESISAMYRRYSDDILIVCPPAFADAAESKILELIAAEKLEINAAKNEKTAFDKVQPLAASLRSAQYLGFAYYPGGAGIRSASLARQWRKMRRNVMRVRRAAEAAISKGKASKVYTKTLRRRFSPLQFRNFLSYARRSAAEFGGGEKISHQARRLERAFEAEILKIKNSLSSEKS